MRALGLDLKKSRLGIASALIDFHLKNGAAEMTVPVRLQPPDVASFRDHTFEEVIYSHLELNGLRRASRPDPTALAAE
ncbi:hypothetical protein [Wenxinia marina]|uniref:Uncharacterized protein n=1 Tax=Wenxinia marina DSM 24838 TaxID=1123501 RepID=A0A0D0QAX0_9RHOB|nr:hypothetical protein [Wenxinia marina]KIQ69452.1 hypothetical protein Wenmar_01814 [Wenxinia marina DSM 24838]GGL58478.1 hypothetical protein GCM10011392_11160 [Wenxinia marina]